MMKENSIIHSYPLPPAAPQRRAEHLLNFQDVIEALSFAGLLRTLPNLSAKGPPLGTHNPAAFCSRLYLCDNHKIYSRDRHTIKPTPCKHLKPKGSPAVLPSWGHL